LTDTAEAYFVQELEIPPGLAHSDIYSTDPWDLHMLEQYFWDAGGPKLE
jgi:hypothetical protein